MADDYSGGAGAGGGGNEWELVSLTASTYAAAPGPVPVRPLLPFDAHKETESHPPPAIFMSQHFNLPAEPLGAGLDLNGGREKRLTPVVMVDGEGVTTDDDLTIPCPEDDDDRETETQDDGRLTLTSSDHQQGVSTTAFGLEDAISFADAANSLPLPGEEERQAPFGGSHATHPDAAGSDSAPAHNVSAADAAATTDGVPVDSASLVAAPNKGPFSSKIPCEAHAWWRKTFSFLRNNSKESLTFRFIFVAATVAGLTNLGPRDELQLRLESNVDTEKISCAVNEPLGQVKVSMLAGSPVTQG